MFKGFVFDLDGVIAETAGLHYLAWKEEVKSLGIDYTEVENIKLKGMPRMDTLLAILKVYKIEGIAQEKLVAISNKKNQTYLKMLETSINEKDILPGIKKLLIKAQANNIKLLITSSSSNAPLILQKLGIYDMFDYIANPAKIKKGKPAPDIFLDAVKGGNLKPEECIGFEDAMAGVEGLLKANIRTVAITNGDAGDWHKAQMVLANTSELTYEKILEKFKSW